MKNGYISAWSMTKWLDDLILDEKKKFCRSYENFQQEENFEKKIVHYTNVVKHLSKIDSFENLKKMFSMLPDISQENNNTTKSQVLLRYYNFLSEHVKVAG